MSAGPLYCVIIGGVALAAVLFVMGTIFWMYVTDKWSKRDDPGAPGFLELDMRGRKDNRRDAEGAEDAERTTDDGAMDKHG